MAMAAPPDLKLSDSGQIDFVRAVRPIISDDCFACHGPDAETRMARLRLDTREGLLAERKTNPIINPGGPAGSWLVARLVHEKPALRMPPPASGRSLSLKDIDTVRKWIEQGAK